MCCFCFECSNDFYRSYSDIFSPDVLLLLRVFKRLFSLTFQSLLQVSQAVNFVYQSKVELTCKPPYFNASPDNQTQNFIVCQSDGTWSFDEVTLQCEPCDQSEDAANISNTVFENQSDANTQYGHVARVRCEEHSILVGSNATANCVSVDGKPTWMVDSPYSTMRCLRYLWTTPEQVSFKAFTIPLPHV